MMVPCAYLRVFEPLDVLPEADRERWGRYVAEGGGLSVGSALHTEQRVARTTLLTGRRTDLGDAALVRRVGRRVHLCPLQLAERQAVALLAFRDLIPDAALDAFVDPREARAAFRSVEQLRRPPHIQDSSWEVPLRWFAAFEPGERHFVNPPEGPGPRLTYLTRCEQALDRLDHVIEVVEAGIEDAEVIVGPLSDLMDWIANFDVESLLELDYGGLAGVIAPADLATDLSCEEVWGAVDGLERGDAVSAVTAYEAVAGRWQSLRTRLRAN